MNDDNKGTLTQSDFDKLPYESQRAFASGGGTVTTTGQSTPGAFLAALNESGVKVAISRDRFEAMGPHEQARFIRGGGRISMGAAAPPRGGTKTCTRAEFAAMTVAERRDFQLSGGRADI